MIPEIYNNSIWPYASNESVIALTSEATEKVSEMINSMSTGNTEEYNTLKEELDEIGENLRLLLTLLGQPGMGDSDAYSH